MARLVMMLVCCMAYTHAYAAEDQQQTLSPDYKTAQDIMAGKNIDGKRKKTKQHELELLLKQRSTAEFMSLYGIKQPVSDKSTNSVAGKKADLADAKQGSGADSSTGEVWAGWGAPPPAPDVRDLPTVCLETFQRLGGKTGGKK